MTRTAGPKHGDNSKQNIATNPKLRAVVDKYRRSPEFFFIELTDINQTGMTGDTLLHAAVTRGELEDVELLLTSGAKVNAAGDLGNTPLHEAASRGLVNIVKTLLRYGADINIRNEFGETPLDLAELMERLEVVRVFKQRHLGRPR
jgi:ankyrin repeat protein